MMAIVKNDGFGLGVGRCWVVLVLEVNSLGKNSLLLCKLLVKELGEIVCKIRSGSDVTELQCRLQLKVGIETQKRDEQQKKQMTKELEDLIKTNASESAFSKHLMTYVKRFSDYGEDRTRIIQKHMKVIDQH